MNISCKVTGVFPLPHVKLTHGHFELVQDHVEVVLNSLSYDVIIFKLVEEDNIKGRFSECK